MNSQVYGSAKGMRNALSINFFKSALFAAALIVSVGIFLVSCEPHEKEWVSADTPFCNCTVNYGEEELKLSPPEMQEDTILNSILDKAGFSLRPFKICKVKNIPDKNIAAFATVINDFPYIVYDEKKVNKMKRANKWALHLLLAHEVGHLVNYHPIDHSLSKHEIEIEADIYSGFLMHKFGMPLEESFNLLSEDAKATKKHPAGKDRRAAFEKGWLRASSLSPLQPPQEMKYPIAPPKRRFAKVGDNNTPVIVFNGREIMSTNLRYKLGNPITYGNSFFNQGLLYSRIDAEKACRAMGWELMTNEDFLLLIANYTVDSNDPLDVQGFDATRAYGALINGGDCGFNASLGGYGVESFGSLNFNGEGKIGNYWISDMDSYYNQPLYFSFNSEEGRLVRYRSNSNMLNYCRCARDVQEQSNSNGQIGINN